MRTAIRKNHWFGFGFRFWSADGDWILAFRFAWWQVWMENDEAHTPG